MPGDVRVTATGALTNATMPYVRWLAAEAPVAALAADPGFAHGLTAKGGEIVHGPVARAFEQGAPVAAR